MDTIPRGSAHSKNKPNRNGSFRRSRPTELTTSPGEAAGSLAAAAFRRLATPRVLSELRDLESNYSNSRLYTETKQILFHEIEIGALIIQGEFTSSYEVRLSQKSSDPSQQDATTHSNTKTYTMKSLNPFAIEQSPNAGGASKLAIAAQELYLEAYLLSECEHPNIVRLQGVAAEGLVGTFSHGMPYRENSRADYGYYILLEPKTETLEQRIAKWRQAQHMRFTFGKSHRKLSLSTSESLKGNFHERMVVATSIAKALSFLHANHIVFRDLCPKSIGFFYDHSTGEEVVKLYDFGMARVLEESFLETTLTGNFRYMAPEIMLCQPSGTSGDIYSFGVLLWELATLKSPFSEFFTTDKQTRKQIFAQAKFTNQVILNKQWRPPCNTVSDSETRRLIHECWCSNPEARPNASQVLWRLQRAIALPRPSYQRRFSALVLSKTQGKQNESTRVHTDHKRQAPARRRSFFSAFRRGSSNHDLSAHSTLEQVARLVQEDENLQSLLDPRGEMDRDDNSFAEEDGRDDSMEQTSLSVADLRARLSLPTIEKKVTFRGVEKTICSTERKLDMEKKGNMRWKNAALGSSDPLPSVPKRGSSTHKEEALGEWVQ